MRSIAFDSFNEDLLPLKKVEENDCDISVLILKGLSLAKTKF